MSVQVSTRIDEATKIQFDKVCEAIGVSPSYALSMFIKGVINHNGVPFKITAPKKVIKSSGEAASPSKDNRRAILRSLYGSIDDPTLVDPAEIVYESPRDWGLIDL